MADAKSGKYQVFVDDNFHYLDDSERYRLGTFDDCQSAIEKCKEIVDRTLLDSYRKGISAEKLFSSYTAFGEDPWISSADSDCTFSAWSYAKQRCKEICGDHS
ncbi:MAG: hypothetical protein HY231_15310 [Acidobacteria bacterium]|nr:hypothetical protein [Acidobacteriota bacterium]